jgi:hypothetical protein
MFVEFHIVMIPPDGKLFDDGVEIFSTIEKFTIK